MNYILRIALASSLSVLLVACSDPPLDSDATPVVVDGGMNNAIDDGRLQGYDLTTLGALSALEDETDYSVGGVKPIIYFGYNQYQVDSQGQAIINHYAKYFLSTSKHTNLVVEGHTDERGSHEYNMALGERRAKAVRDAFVIAGVPSNRVRVVSFGEEKPAVDGSSEHAWSMNRRVDLKFPTY